MTKKLTPEDFELTVNPTGELIINNLIVTDLADEFGTPLYVLNEKRLKETATDFQKEAEKNFPGKITVHYPFKCNSIPAAVQVLKNSGLAAEVMSEFELQLALKIGYKPNEIIVNGPCKTNSFLSECIHQEVKFLIIDSLDELHSVIKITEEKNQLVQILLRINPNYIPKGMNQGTATASRKGSPFGLDLIGGEVHRALNMIKNAPKINFCGYHFHIGTGIRDPKDYSNTLKKIKPVIEYTIKEGFKIKIMDIGGGFASFTTRELTSIEMLVYQSLNRFPKNLGHNREYSFSDFTKEISRALLKIFKNFELPELIYEPGRCITSSNQFLLLKVHRIKERSGIGKWIITDGGLGTITLPTFYEYHEIFLCNNVKRPVSEHVTISGPCCFAADIVYKNKLLPKVEKGEVLALMDTGAYFNGLESNFGFPRPAIISVSKGQAHLVRERENYNEMIMRDKVLNNLLEEK